MMNEIMLVNITWNPHGWKTSSYINPRAGHEYAKSNVAGESLNFAFNKEGVDTERIVFGYSKWTKKPKRFSNGGLIIFYTTNTDIGMGQLVGLYGNAKVLDPTEKFSIPFQGFPYHFTFSAEKDLSLLFPVPLPANDFKDASNNRTVGQIEFAYKNIAFAKKVLEHEIDELLKLGNCETEYRKLLDVYEIYIGEKFYKKFLTNDEKEQTELEKIFSRMSKKELLEYINSLRDSDSTVITIKRKTYRRDNKTVALIKILRDFKCQICSSSIIKKDGSRYIEAAHIKPKHRMGIEKPENILLLCPNHHKEFDLGNLEIINHDKERLFFRLNETAYDISLTF